MPPPPPPPPMPENGPHIPEPKETPPIVLILMNIVNTMTHLFLGAIAVSAFIYANLFRSSPFVHQSHSQHIYLTVTGYVILMSQAILTMSPYNGWANCFHYEDRKTIHWVMQICGSILAIAGSCVQIAYLDNNFQTVHGCLGILAMMFTIISLLGGFVNLFLGNLKFTAKTIKLFHSCLGSLTIIVAFLSLIFGFDQNSFRNVFTDSSADMLIGFTIIALVGILMPAGYNLLSRLNN